MGQQLSPVALEHAGNLAQDPSGSVLERNPLAFRLELVILVGLQDLFEAAVNLAENLLELLPSGPDLFTLVALDSAHLFDLQPLDDGEQEIGCWLYAPDSTTLILAVFSSPLTEILITTENAVRLLGWGLGWQSDNAGAERAEGYVEPRVLGLSSGRRRVLQLKISDFSKVGDELDHLFGGAHGLLQLVGHNK